MKKLQQLSISVKALMAICGISVLAGGGVMIANALDADTRINADEAKQIALKDAGVASSQAQFEKAALEKEDGRNVYDVKFQTSEHEYEYTIASKDGVILNRDVEALKKESAAKTSSISLEEAKKLMLRDAGLKESDGTFTKTASKQDDGQAVYEIEFTTAKTSYEYKLLAKDGSVLEKDVENIKKTKSNSGGNGSSNSTNSSGSTLISKSEARNKALADAGVRASNATFTKTALDYEDGQPVYDVEFITSDTEYDYEINAVNGTIRERKSEKLEVQSQAQSKPTASYIGVDTAKSTALQHAGLKAGSITFTKAKLENDDGISVYEIEFRKGNTEYDYTIDAYKGTILEWDKDTDYDD